MGDALDKASSIWANLLTQKQLQSLGIKDEEEAKPNKRPRRKEHSVSTSASSDNTKAMVQVMAKILLRHEDSLHVLLQEYEFVLWIQPGEGSLLPILLARHVAWQKSNKSTSLRHSMALCMIETLKERLDILQKAPASEDMVQDCIKYHLIDANQMMPFLRWDAGGTAIAADQGQASSHRRGESDHPDDPSDPSIGTGHHPSLPLPLQSSDGRGLGQGSPISMDCGQSHTGRTLESLANRVISQHLATCEIDPAATDPTTHSACEAAGKDDVDDRTKFLVRILENDTSTMCFVNAALIALAWCTLLCQGMKPSCWAFGFELLRGICQWNLLPLNLRVFQPFLWLLFGAFQIADLAVQQDILEFTAFIIDRLSPSFISCRWCTKFQHITRVSHPVLDSEKGDRYAPILLRFVNYLDDTCNLTDLIANWHDSSGLCRASNQERRCLILMFDRHVDGQNSKCTQKVQWMSDTVSFPCFADAEGNVAFQPFSIAAVAYHIGHTPNTGHHRTALKYHGQWLVYDDNRLPDHSSVLRDEVLRNITMIWLVQPNAHCCQDNGTSTWTRPPSVRASCSSPIGSECPHHRLHWPLHMGAADEEAGPADNEPAAKRSKSDTT